MCVYDSKLKKKITNGTKIRWNRNLFIWWWLAWCAQDRKDYKNVLMLNYVCNFVCVYVCESGPVCIWKKENRRVWSSINMSCHCYFMNPWMICFHFWSIKWHIKKQFLVWIAFPHPIKKYPLIINIYYVNNPCLRRGFSYLEKKNFPHPRWGRCHARTGETRKKEIKKLLQRWPVGKSKNMCLTSNSTVSSAVNSQTNLLVLLF